MKLSFILSPELEGEYEVVNTASPILHSRIGDIDFRRITKDQAEQLISAGTRYLVRVKKKVKRS
ncbi:hypothetical protein D3C87_1480670 [compost metagenome]